MAPASRTESMLHVSTIATGLLGMHNFAPLVVFDAETSGALMAALLIHDITYPATSLSNPALPIDHPMDLFIAKAVHGGGWRAAYTSDSVSTAVYVSGKLAPKPDDPTIDRSKRGC